MIVPSVGHQSAWYPEHDSSMAARRGTENISAVDAKVISSNLESTRISTASF